MIHENQLEQHEKRSIHTHTHTHIETQKKFSNSKINNFLIKEKLKLKLESRTCPEYVHQYHLQIEMNGNEEN